MARQTPLYEQHLLLNARMIDFAGWLLPVQYRGIADEHLAVRQAAGLFDVSHMGEILVTGPGTADFLQYLLTRDLGSLAIAAASGRVFYSPLCAASGGTIDDLLAYPLADDCCLLVVNAVNTSADQTHCQALAQAWKGPSVAASDVSDTFAQMALQGPRSLSVLQQACRQYPLLASLAAAAAALRRFHFCSLDLDLPAPAGPVRLICSRTGYTGEDGFEFYLPPAATPWLWQALLTAGAEPAGLGARDTLRLEAGLPLYGHELSLTITPREAGLDRFIDLSKAAFLGKTALAAAPGRRLIGLQSLSRAIPRAGYPVLLAGQPIGSVTSGSFSPSLSRGIAMALVDAAADVAAAPLAIEIRRQPEPCALCPLPFINR